MITQVAHNLWGSFRGPDRRRSIPRRNASPRDPVRFGSRVSPEGGEFFWRQPLGPAEVGSLAREDGSTRSRDFRARGATPRAESDSSERETSLRTFIYLFSRDGTREELLPSENFRVNKTTLTNTDPPFINCTDRAPNGAVWLAGAADVAEERFELRQHCDAKCGWRPCRLSFGLESLETSRDSIRFDTSILEDRIECSRGIEFLFAIN